MDYRALNAIKVKDRFPILIVDKLLDGLPHATIFLRLDFCFGYHQIKMFVTTIFWMFEASTDS